MGAIRWIGKIAGKTKYLIAAASLLQCLVAGVGIAIALAMRRAVDSAASGDRNGFMGAALFLGGLILLQLLLRATGRILTDESRVRLENQLRQKVFGAILRMDHRVAAGYHTGELMNRITSDVAVAADGAASLLPGLASMAVRIVGVLAVLYTIEPWFALILLAGGCLFVGTSMLPHKWLKRLHRKVQESDGLARCFLQESMESLLVIHAFGCEGKMEKISGKKLRAYRRACRKKSGVSALLGAAMGLAMQGCYLLGFFFCGAGIVSGSITYGTMTAVMQLVGQIQTPIAELGNMLPRLVSMLASSERLIELENEKTGARKAESTAAAQLYAAAQELVFSGVSFSYDADTRVLENVSFAVKTGEFAALVGESGIGKSTLMKLLLSVYEPDAGEIYLRLADRNIPAEQLPQGMFAYVPQGNHLMSGTIRQAVGFAERSGTISMERVEEACRAACAHEFIKALPEGYDTILGEKGAGLSEGQMQRLAVARAIYSGCPVLLLDEATSALDGATELAMIRNMKTLPGRTVFLITHREEVLQLCDRVLRCQGSAVEGASQSD